MPTVRNVFLKTLSIYFNTFYLMMGFGIFIILSLILLPLLSSYVSVGGGFIRFSSIIFDMTLLQAVVLIVVTLVSLLLLSFFVSAVISVVKVKETLDEVTFERVKALFPKYVWRIFFFFLLIGVVSILIGTFLDFIYAPRFLTHLILAAVWLAVVFTPQILILEDLPLGKAINDTLTFVRNSPIALVWYVVFGLLCLFFLALLEVALGLVLVWEHHIITVILVSMLVLPLLEILGAELYIRRYHISRV